jgi:hypothetical protein
MLGMYHRLVHIRGNHLKRRHQLKKLTLFLCSLALGFSGAGVALATPVGLDLAGPTGGSSQSLNGTVGSSALDANLGTQIFYLSDGQTQTIDMTGGTLKWAPKTLPDVITVAGNSLTTNFQGGSSIAGVNAWRLPPWFPPRHPWPPCPKPNPGPGPAPVPEPGTILLLGSGFMGLAFYGRRRMKG